MRFLVGGVVLAAVLAVTAFTLGDRGETGTEQVRADNTVIQEDDPQGTIKR